MRRLSKNDGLPILRGMLGDREPAGAPPMTPPPLLATLTAAAAAARPTGEILVGDLECSLWLELLDELLRLE
jgi:hypothetical protein